MRPRKRARSQRWRTGGAAATHSQQPLRESTHPSSISKAVESQPRAAEKHSQPKADKTLGSGNAHAA